MIVEASGWSIGMLLGCFVMLYCVIWWLNSRFDEILRELKNLKK